MSDFATWLTGENSWGEALRDHSIAETFQRVETFAGDLANLCAQQHEALEPFEAVQDGATDPRVGLVQPVTVAEVEAVNDALAAAREFQEKYD